MLVSCLMIDFSKAFVRVCHRALLTKFVEHDRPLPAINWTMSKLSGTFSNATAGRILTLPMVLELVPCGLLSWRGICTLCANCTMITVPPTSTD